ncbi:hypothetical protein D3C73_1472260 [compost metagenome]
MGLMESNYILEVASEENRNHIFLLKSIFTKVFSAIAVSFFGVLQFFNLNIVILNRSLVIACFIFVLLLYAASFKKSNTNESGNYTN